jgi:hypothetical protein
MEKEEDRMTVMSENVEVYDSDGIQILWRSAEDLNSWLEGKELKFITTPTVLRKGSLDFEMVVTRIQIVGAQ